MQRGQVGEHLKPGVGVLGDDPVGGGKSLRNGTDCFIIRICLIIGPLFAAGGVFQGEDRFHAVRELIQVFPGDEDIVVVGFPDRVSKFLGVHKGIALVDEDDGIPDAGQPGLPVGALQHAAGLGAGDGHAALRAQGLIVLEHSDERGFSGAAVTANDGEVAFQFQGELELFAPDLNGIGSFHGNCPYH